MATPINMGGLPPINKDPGWDYWSDFDEAVDRWGYGNVPLAYYRPEGMGGGGGGGGFGGLGGLSSGPTYNIPDAPTFSAPQFSAPTLEEAMASPGYQFRLGEGQRALEQSAAARGLLRTGGTLKDILAYGQNFASQEYANVYDRALSAYDRRYQAARDEFTPRFSAWQTLVPVEQRRGDLAFQREWDMYTFPRELQQERDLAVLNAGLGAF